MTLTTVNRMNRKKKITSVSSVFFAAAVAFCCGGCAAARGFRNLHESEIARHAPTGLAFPARVGQFKRFLAQERLDDNTSLRVGYNHLHRYSPHIVIITVKPRSADPTETLRLRQQTFRAEHPDAVVASGVTSSSLALFRDWHTIVFDYRDFVADFPPGMRSQPRRLLCAAREYEGYCLLLETNAYYEDFEGVFLFALDTLVRDLFSSATQSSSVALDDLVRVKAGN